MAFLDWLNNQDTREAEQFKDCADRVDNIRMALEEQLIEAFATPFDREDIYTFSVRMNRILDALRLARGLVETLSLQTDRWAVMMVMDLAEGVDALAKGTALLEQNPQAAGKTVEVMRSAHGKLQDSYCKALADIYSSEHDVLAAMKVREVYREIREAAHAFDLTVDVFHRIIVRLI
ncbi:MAG: phosphate transport regulator related to PhoU [Firmicutes bacterium]|nr:phosphate transport regulator related to PhoU [Bacillota bacterium]